MGRDPGPRVLAFLGRRSSYWTPLCFSSAGGRAVWLVARRGLQLCFSALRVPLPRPPRPGLCGKEAGQQETYFTGPVWLLYGVAFAPGTSHLGTHLLDSHRPVGHQG